MDAPLHTPLYGWNDFQTIELSIEGMNHTSQVAIRTSPTSPLRLMEMNEDGAWIEMPARSCAVGHTLSLQILAKMIQNRATDVQVQSGTADSAEPLHFTAMVDAIEGDATSGSQQVLISFRQHTPSEWKELVRYFSNKQAKLNQLLWRTRQ